MTSNEVASNHTAKIAHELAQFQPRRSQRYAEVHVLLLSWKDDDIGCADEIEDLKIMFREDFGYRVWQYIIPSKDPERSLNVQVANLLQHFGHQNNLIIVYYGGHGGPKVNTKSPCTWAANNDTDGPSLDWSLIQPQLFISSADVLIILDCCFAGQAARERTAGSVELLAATDKDKSTPTGKKLWPSFTAILMRELREMLKLNDVVTVPRLQRRLVQAEAGLQRQPFYVSLSGSAGTIKLAPLSNYSANSTATRPPLSSRAIQVQLSFFEDLDLVTAGSLIKWLTRDSPSSIEDIRLVSQVLSDANAVNDMSMNLLDDSAGSNAKLLPCLSEDGRKEAQKLLTHLRRSFSSLEPIQIDDANIMSIIRGIKEASSRLVTFVTDSLTRCEPALLKSMQIDASLNIQDIKSRISMRLMVTGNEPPDNVLRVNYDTNSSANQRLRLGRVRDDEVLVEYVDYDNTAQNAYARMMEQIKRVSALHAEAKSSAFRCLESLGYSHETLYGPRFGFVYALPPQQSGKDYHTLSDLFGLLKTVPLDARLRMACRLCNAILHLHSVGWFHKNIKSQNVLVFSNHAHTENQNNASSLPWDLDQPFLIGFDCSRPTDAETRGTIDFSASNIYRHPERWGRPMRFQNHHDFYALGILLAEIGCWRRFTAMSKPGYLESVRDPEQVRIFLLGEVQQRLSHCVGMAYAKAVKACLEKRDWSEFEDWQSQEYLRQKVFVPLERVAESL